MFEDLRTLELDVEIGKLKLNGRDYSNISSLELIFKDGVFQLNLTNSFYATGKKKAPDKTSAEIMEQI